MAKAEKKERAYITVKTEGAPDLTPIWSEMLLRIKRGENYAKRH